MQSWVVMMLLGSAQQMRRAVPCSGSGPVSRLDPFAGSPGPSLQGDRRQEGGQPGHLYLPAEGWIVSPISNPNLGSATCYSSARAAHFRDRAGGSNSAGIPCEK